MMPWYKSGTVSVTQNSNAVIGTNTAFIANSRVGDGFRGPDGGWYEVTNIASNTAMSIAPNYQGATNSAGGYALAPMQGYVKDSADALRALVNQFGSTLAVLGTSGTLAGVRAALGITNTDGLPEGAAKYFTEARVRGTPLTGFSSADASSVLAGDSVLTGIGKIQARLISSGLGYDAPLTSIDHNNKPCGTIGAYQRTDWTGTTPDAGGGSMPAWFNVLSMGIETRKSMIVMQAYNVSSAWPRMWIRARHDNNYSSECEVYTTKNTMRSSDGTLKAI
ncbi:Tail fiber domain protein [Pseudomonas syringae pv. helianthi]|uniref:Tail fiber domain protein n=1 Tax=Pseudomonas syringae pv. helianthi TaxID=251654 RepID=A0A0P9RHY1_9PSED|nr:Tail fiber domain protein [Pseudomonas syringae pv. helianthi]